MLIVCVSKYCVALCKDAKRKEAQEQRDIEYHNKRMNDFR